MTAENVLWHFLFGMKASMVRDVMMHTSGLTYGFLEDSPVSRDYARGKLFDARAPLDEAIEGKA